MKKLALFLSFALLLFIGCGSNNDPGTQPDLPKITVTTSNNGDGTSTISWASNDLTIDSVEIVDSAGANVLSAGPVGSTTLENGFDYTLLAYAGPALVDSIPINLGSLPGPPPPPPLSGEVTFYVSWSLPTLYADNTVIEQAALDNMVTQVYWKTTNTDFTESDELIATSVPGGTQVEITKTVEYDKIYYFGARCHVSPDGLWSEFTAPQSHSWPTP